MMVTNALIQEIRIIEIDLMLYAHKYEYSCGSIYPGFINQILNFMSNQIIPVYIIDDITN